LNFGLISGEMALVSYVASDHADRMARVKAPVPTEDISRAIVILRGHRVLRDSELAGLYDVTTKRLNEQVKRNADRVPVDFIFRLPRQGH
jgi:ORF6N domain